MLGTSIGTNCVVYVRDDAWLMLDFSLPCKCRVFWRRVGEGGGVFKTFAPSLLHSALCGYTKIGSLRLHV